MWDTDRTLYMSDSMLGWLRYMLCFLPWRSRGGICWITGWALTPHSRSVVFIEIVHLDCRYVLV